MNNQNNATPAEIKEIEEDISVANNVRARRRRQRARERVRRARGLQPQQPIGSNVANRTNFGVQRRRARQNARDDVKESLPEFTTMEMVKIQDIISPELRRFSEAVTNPFGNEAIGALLPDQFQELVTPCVDRHEIDLAFTGFNYRGDWTTDSTVRLLGTFVWIQPRCIEAGTIATDGVGTGAPLYPAWANPGAPATSDAQILTHQYVLCYTGIWSTSGGNTVGFYDGTQVSGTIGYRMLPYPRITSIDDNMVKGRILGAGLKIWSEEAPINTGGYVVGGWSTLAEILEATTDPAKMLSFQSRIKGSVRRPGLKGCTVRYSCLQTPAQLEAERVIIPDDFYEAKLVDTVHYVPVAESGIDMSTYDVITPGTFVPCAFWRFNNTNPGATANTEGVYTLKIMSMLHFEGSPNGISPFMSHHITKDIGIEHVKSLLENWEVFPPATGGHSFKSFMTKARHVVAKVSKGAQHFARLMALVDQFASTMQ